LKFEVGEGAESDDESLDALGVVADELLDA
jgi:hypothetical protein